MRSNHPDELDQFLEEALATYSSQEPPLGLEQRVLHRVHAAGVSHRVLLWRWALAIPVLASLLMIAVSQRTRPQGHAAEPTVVPTPVELRAAAPRVRRPVNRAHAAPPPPRRAVFPLPAPLSPEERALVDLVTRFPTKREKY